MSLDVTLRVDGVEVYTDNITHNLNTMADEAGIYMQLWRPDELGITKAGDIVPELQLGLCRLVDEPTYFSTFNSPNGWGTWKNLVRFVSFYIEACRKYPDAIIEVCR